jgi:hypothetical protein
MKLLTGSMLSVLISGFSLCAVNAQTVSIQASDDSQLNTDTKDLYDTQVSADNPSSLVYAYNDDSDYDDSDEESSDEYAEDEKNTYFDLAYKKLAYNTPQYRGPSGRSTFIFDPNRHRWYAYDRDGELVGSGRASGGKGYCPDVKRACRTPVGTFRIYNMGGPGCISKKFPIGKGGAPMPYCMFFHGGYAIHGSYDVPNYNASHGCIRVEPSAARWLRQNVLTYGSTVIVRSY